MRTFRIYFSDFKEETQKALLKAAGVNDPKKVNWDADIIPIAQYDFEEDFDEDDD